VTLEDIVEALVGEVHDALEAVQPSIQDTPDGRVPVRGEVRLRALNERLGGAQDEELDTIAGYIMKCVGSTARVRRPCNVGRYDTGREHDTGADYSGGYEG